MVVVSAVAGTGIVEFATTLDAVWVLSRRRVPTGRSGSGWIGPSPSPVRAVLTGTLPAGTLTAGDRLELLGGTRTREVTVRPADPRTRDCDVAGPAAVSP